MPARRRSTCATSAPSACWCWSTASAGSTNPPPPASAAAPTSTPSRWHRRAHRSAGRRRLGDLRLGRHRRRGQHHHPQGIRRRRSQRLLRRVREGRRDHRGQPHARRRRRALLRPVRRQLLRAGGDQLRRVGAVVVPAAGLAGLAAGSSGMPQGRFIFCDPARPAGSYGSCSGQPGFFYDVTLNDGTTTPVWNPADPTRRAPTTTSAAPTASTSRRTTCC